VLVDQDPIAVRTSGMKVADLVMLSSASFVSLSLFNTEFGLRIAERIRMLRSNMAWKSRL
jgi:hypothetical protein